jgi:3-deoxy-D-manno-octulosonate 8-phosphate phosphatase KdsC-like HAD superfamily phosphatase
MIVDYGVAITVIFGIFSMYIAWRMESLIREMRQSQIDEKIAVIYGTASEVVTWRKLGLDSTLNTNKVVSEIAAALRVEKSMRRDQFDVFEDAINQLIDAMKKEGFTKEADRLEKLTGTKR